MRSWYCPLDGPVNKGRLFILFVYRVMNSPAPVSCASVVVLFAGTHAGTGRTGDPAIKVAKLLAAVVSNRSRTRMLDGRWVEETVKTSGMHRSMTSWFRPASGARL